MSDQATELRKLVLRSARESSAHAGPQPRLVVISGGKGGVGATTLSVQLSIALAEQGSRVVLVDADLRRADVALLCGLQEQRSVADVLTSRSDIHEVLVRGPSGVLVVPGLWAPGSTASFSETTQLRLIKQLRLLGRHADIVLLDVGCGSPEVLRRFWQAANDIIMVTTPDSVSVMDCYATIKTVLAGEQTDSLRVIVNRAASAAVADDVHQRINQSCQRFLGVSITPFGHAPEAEWHCATPGSRDITFKQAISITHPEIARIASTLLGDTFIPAAPLPSVRRAA